MSTSSSDSRGPDDVTDANMEYMRLILTRKEGRLTPEKVVCLKRLKSWCIQERNNEAFCEFMRELIPYIMQMVVSSKSQSAIVAAIEMLATIPGTPLQTLLTELDHHVIFRLLEGFRNRKVAATAGRFLASCGDNPISTLVDYLMDREMKLQDHDPLIVDSLLAANVEVIKDFGNFLQLLNDRHEEEKACSQLLSLMSACFCQMVTGKGPLDEKVAGKRKSDGSRPTANESAESGVAVPLTESLCRDFLDLLDQFAESNSCIVYVLKMIRVLHFRSLAEFYADVCNAILTEMYKYFTESSDYEVLDAYGQTLAALFRQENVFEKLPVRCQPSNLISGLQKRFSTSNRDHREAGTEEVLNASGKELLASLRHMTAISRYTRIDAFLDHWAASFDWATMEMEPERIDWNLPINALDFCLTTFRWQLEQELNKAGEKLKTKRRLSEKMEATEVFEDPTVMDRYKTLRNACEAVLVYEADDMALVLQQQIYESLCRLLLTTVDEGAKKLRFPISLVNERIGGALISFVRKRVFLASDSHLSKGEQQRELVTKYRLLRTMCNLLMIEPSTYCFLVVLPDFYLQYKIPMRGILEEMLCKVRNRAPTECGKRIIHGLIVLYKRQLTEHMGKFQEEACKEIVKTAELLQSDLSRGSRQHISHEWLYEAHATGLRYALKPIAESTEPLVPSSNLGFLCALQPFTKNLRGATKDLLKVCITEELEDQHVSINDVQRLVHREAAWKHFTNYFISLD